MVSVAIGLFALLVPALGGPSNRWLWMAAVGVSALVWAYLWSKTKWFRALCPSPLTFSPSGVEGQLVQGHGQPEVYIVRDGRKHWVQSPEIWKASRLSGVKPFLLPAEWVDMIPTGQPLASAEQVNEKAFQAHE
jgi:hypothetical protein